MFRTPLFVGLLMVVVGSVAQPRLPDVRPGPDSPRTALPDSEIIVRHVISPQVIALYDALTPLSILEQRDVLRNVQSDVKAALWTYNCYVFLDNHPDLTLKQRIAIDANLRYLAIPHIFDYSDEPTQHRLNASAMEALSAKIEAADFPQELNVTVFFHLGPEAPPRQDAQAQANHQAPSQVGTVATVPQRPSRPDTYGPCICRSAVDCWGYYAIYCSFGDICLPTNGCGFDGNQACVGVCGGGM